ncbi:hypothetical protein SCMU_13680 [Sinomonas cyclohexanicum]|uniref:Collagen triple helix repeat-containing protein n=1 Tax=Sinomonas cyclohexanicum TaxID=322009 RepID=A0ABM7PTN4_SINCY|nr:hypothetical protein [Corynebacterium cyclohexanicum]BCT75526.1 hypothetical protein SCMU_13680 [Corynebacterium cyclohexanicum]
MPQITIYETSPAVSGTNTPAPVTFEFTPTAAFTGPGASEEVLPVAFTADTDVTGHLTVNLAVTGGTWAWTVRKYYQGRLFQTETVTVKSTDTSYPALVRVNPFTLAAVAADPAWVAMANSTVTSGSIDGNGHLILTRTDSTTTDAGAVVGPAGAAGATGPAGPTGPAGATGPAGPADTITIGTVSTLAAGSSATASMTGASPNQTLNLGIPTGATGAQGPTGPQGPGATYDYTGTGSPVGAITPASAGRIYLDTAGTNGAWRWMSTGTTNTAWTVVYGDTGWRLLPITDGVTGVTFAIRRVNGTVDFESVWNSNSAAETAIVIPAGFNPHMIAGNTYLRFTGGRFGISTTPFYVIPGQKIGTGATGLTDSHYNGTWTAAEQWPTTLPGTPA